MHYACEAWRWKARGSLPSPLVKAEAPFPRSQRGAVSRSPASNRDDPESVKAPANRRGNRHAGAVFYLKTQPFEAVHDKICNP
jgi:hypothetical protein